MENIFWFINSEEKDALHQSIRSKWHKIEHNREREWKSKKNKGRGRSWKETLRKCPKFQGWRLQLKLTLPCSERKIMFLMCISEENTCGLVESTLKFPAWVRNWVFCLPTMLFSLLQTLLLHRKGAVIWINFMTKILKESCHHSCLSEIFTSHSLRSNLLLIGAAVLNLS